MKALTIIATIVGLVSGVWGFHLFATSDEFSILFALGVSIVLAAGSFIGVFLLVAVLYAIILIALYLVVGIAAGLIALAAIMFVMWVISLIIVLL